MNKKLFLLLIVLSISTKNTFANYYQYSTPWFGITLDIEKQNTGKKFPEWGDLMLKMEDAFQSHDIKVYETKDGKRWGIEIGLPGFKKDEIKITIKEKGILTIKAETIEKKKEVEEKEEKNKIYIYKSKRSEKKYFSKTFKLPENVDWQNTKETKLSYEKGILKIEFPTKKEIRPQKVTLKFDTEKKEDSNDQKITKSVSVPLFSGTSPDKLETKDLIGLENLNEEK